ncbi:MAG: class I SAM-dependent methyltransferase [Candidatus Bathyarchaeia archaeon]
MQVSGEFFERKYFEDWHAYHKKRLAIRKLYFDVLKWAKNFADFNLLNGMGGRALDVGCAHGYVVKLLADLGYDAYGCDISHFYLCNYAKKEADGLVTCDAQSLPFLKGSFKLITCFEVLEHLHSPVKFLKECFEVLDPNGVLVMQTPRAIPSLDMLLSKIYGMVIFKTSDVEHHVSTFVNGEHLSRLLELCGFKVVLQTWFFLPFNPLFFERYFPTRIPSTVPTFRVVATKAK